MIDLLGSPACQGAIFIFKDDQSVQEAWSSAENIYKEQGEFRLEHHREKNTFLSSLTKWNKLVDPTNAFLCIYAHSGEPGIAPISNAGDSVVSWNEFGAALPNGVQTLWVLGCESDSFIWYLNSISSKISERLLVTHKSEYWCPMILTFKEEISMDPIRFFDEMPSLIKKKNSELGRHTSYYEWKTNKYVRINTFMYCLIAYLKNLVRTNLPKF
jgi:hypothetical protein